MEKKLLCNSFNSLGTFGKSVGVKLRHYSLNPHIDGEGFNPSAAVEQGTFGNLCADSLDFHQLFTAFIHILICKRRKLNQSVRNLLCGVDYVFCPEACPER